VVRAHRSLHKFYFMDINAQVSALRQSLIRLDLYIYIFNQKLFTKTLKKLMKKSPIFYEKWLIYQIKSRLIHFLLLFLILYSNQVTVWTIFD
jgi:hypothetical protein